MYADRSVVPVHRLLGSLELSDHIFEYSTSRAVKRYLSETHKKREKDKILRPLCLQIMQRELSELPWTDICFHDWVVKMFTGADVSQLESFKTGYNRSDNKSSFFLTFIYTEL